MFFGMWQTIMVPAAPRTLDEEYLHYITSVSIRCCFCCCYRSTVCRHNAVPASSVNLCACIYVCKSLCIHARMCTVFHSVSHECVERRAVKRTLSAHKPPMWTRFSLTTSSPIRDAVDVVDVTIAAAAAVVGLYVLCVPSSSTRSRARIVHTAPKTI